MKKRKLTQKRAPPPPPTVARAPTFSSGRNIQHRKPTMHLDHTLLLPLERVRGVVLAMHEAFPKLCVAWRVRGCMRRNWKLLFERLDKDGSGRLDYEEFQRAARAELDLKDVDEEDLAALWRSVRRAGWVL